MRLQGGVVGRAQRHRAGDHRGTAGPDVIDVAAGQRADRPDQFGCVGGVHHRGQRRPIGCDQPGSFPGGVRGLGDDKGERLADAVHLAVRQDGLRAERADVVAARDVSGGEDGQHARPGECRRGVDGMETGVRVRCRHRLGVQAAVGQWQVGGEPGPALGE